jgi:hypothetical protein
MIMNAPLIDRARRSKSAKREVLEDTSLALDVHSVADFFQG